MNKYLSRNKNTWAKSQNRQDQPGYQTRPGQTKSSKSTFLKLGNAFFSLIGTNICLKLQNVFVFCCNTNIFVQNGGMYLFHITKGTCLKLQNLSKKSKSFWCLCKLIYDQCYQGIVELFISFIMQKM